MVRSDLVRVAAGESPEEPESQFEGLFDAVVTKATQQELHFVIPDYDRHAEFGPAPYPRIISDTGIASAHTHPILGAAPAVAPAVPPNGTDIVVGFVAGDPDRPRVVALYGWPA